MAVHSQLVESAPAAAEPVACPSQPTLSEVLNSIAIDARQAPEKYLRETEVPHGGE